MEGSLSGADALLRGKEPVEVVLHLIWMPTGNPSLEETLE